MGGDGGSICRRAEMVKTKSRVPTMDNSSQREALWYHCYISGEPLREPIVSCSHGHLYNKEAILKYLYNQSSFQNHSYASTFPSSSSSIVPHVKSIRDLVNLKMTRRDINQLDNNYNSNSNFDIDSNICHFKCPITEKEMNGKSAFVYLKNCGCVISESVLTFGNLSKHQILECPNCSMKRIPNDVIVINSGKMDEKGKINMSSHSNSGSNSNPSITSSSTSNQSVQDIIKGNEGLYANTFNRYP